MATPHPTYRGWVLLKDHIKSKHIIIGEHTYYAGYYHDRPFKDCIMYLDELDDTKEAHEVDRLFIGKFCSIATGAKIMMGGTQEHNYNWISSYPLSCFGDDYDIFSTVMPKGQILKGDTIIGNDVWIGAEAMIMPGVHIADGAVIATRSVVTKNVGPYEIWGGNPAKLIKKRFSDDKIEKLLQIKWWDWDDATIQANLPLLQSDQIDTLWDMSNKKIK